MDHSLPVSPWPEWEIVSKIGEGSYGCVYKASRVEQGHAFFSAIKVISIPGSREELNTVLSETGNEASARGYFENVMHDCTREISLMENFRGNSHIVSVEDYKVMEYLDEIGWDIYIRMEFLESLPEYLTENSFHEDDIMKLGTDICKALCYLQNLHVVHRDIKPENIFVSRFGDFKLGDFGIARKMELSLGGLSKKGTWSYMAPEVYHDEPYDARADIYSLGVVLYRLLNHNRLPLIDPRKQLITYHDKEEALRRRMSGEPLPVPTEADEAMASIILKACAFDPDDRYIDAGEMLCDLDLAARGAAPHQRYSWEKEEEPAFIPESQRTEAAALPVETQKNKNESVPEKSSTQSEDEITKGFRSAIPWIAAIVAVAAIVCVFIGIFIRKTLVDTVREQTQQMLTSIQSKSEVQPEDNGQDFASSIELITERATAIVNELPEDTVTGTEGKVLRYYNSDGVLRKVLVYPEESAEGVYEEYFYWNGELFFAYIWDLAGEEMYYYRDGILIRWIDLEGDVHDNEQDDEEYVARGDRYWLNSLLFSAAAE